MTAATIALLWALYQPPTAPWIERGVPHVESRGDRWAVSPRGARAIWQVMPRSAVVPRWLLHVEPIGTWEGRRVLRRWQRRCRGDIRCALRCYHEGNAGMRGAGDEYLADVVAAGGGR